MNHTPTPTPWEVIPHSYGFEIKHTHTTFTESRLTPIATIHGKSLSNETNAELIVRAVNSHEAMKAALEQAQAALGNIVRDYPSDNDDFDELQEAYEAAQQALALAEGKETP